MVKTMCRRITMRGRVAAMLTLGLFLFGPYALGEAKKVPPGPGFVDGKQLIDVVGDDAVLVEVSLGKSLLRMVTGSDPDMKEQLGGLESVYALIVDLSDEETAALVREEVKRIERRLVDDGWEVVEERVED